MAPLQVLEKSSYVEDRDIKTIDDVYSYFKEYKNCFLAFGQLKKKDSPTINTGIEILCDDRGLETIASCQGCIYVPVAHSDFDITASLALEKMQDTIRAVGINIIAMLPTEYHASHQRYDLAGKPL